MTLISHKANHKLAHITVTCRCLRSVQCTFLSNKNMSGGFACLLLQLLCFSDYLGTSLDTYVANLGARVRLLRLRERSGLIRARLAGAREARGSTLAFLDAHCEVTEGWLEPLISHIFLNPHAVVCPAIDVISDTTFEYLQSKLPSCI